MCSTRGIPEQGLETCAQVFSESAVSRIIRAIRHYVILYLLIFFVSVAQEVIVTHPYCFSAHIR